MKMCLQKENHVSRSHLSVFILSFTKSERTTMRSAVTMTQFHMQHSIDDDNDDDDKDDDERH